MQAIQSKEQSKGEARQEDLPLDMTYIESSLYP